MACEDIELATTIAKAIHEIDKNLIYLVPTGSKMELAAKKLDMNIACEIFADRNYEDDGNLVSRSKPHALITNPYRSKKACAKYGKKSVYKLSQRETDTLRNRLCVHTWR